MCLSVAFLFSSYLELSVLGAGCLFSFPRLGSSYPLLHQIIFLPVSSSFPSGTPVMWILFFWFHSPLKISSLFKILFSFCFSVWIHCTALSSRWLILSSGASSLFLNPSSAFFCSVIVFSVLWLLFGLSYIFCIFIEFLTVFIHSSPKFNEHLYDH